MSNTAFPAATIVGYPRVGRFRELKKAQEAFWKGKATLQELQDTAADVQRTYFERVTAAGLKADNYSIPAAFSYYDQVLDVVRLFTLVRPAGSARLLRTGARYRDPTSAGDD